MSLSTIDQSTGNATVISGNVNDKVGNLAALTTTDKSSCEGAINEVKDGLTGEVVSIATGVTLYKQGNFRMLVIYAAESLSGGILANVPASDRPSNQFMYPAIFVENNTTKAGYLQINTNGNVFIRALDDVLKDNCPVYGSFCYHLIN